MLDEFTPENLHLTEVGEFDPQATLDLLDSSEGKNVMGIDMGGDGIKGAKFEVKDGKLVPEMSFESGSRKGGAKYLNNLESVAYSSVHDNIPVGISYAGQINGNSPVMGPNVPRLLEELKAYGGNFDQGSNEGDVLFGDQLKATANDAVAGLYAGALEARRQNPDVENVIYVINGSGLGAAVLKDGVVYASEPGHVKVPSELNPFNRQAPCGQFDRQETCIENVTGGKAGIEATYTEVTGQTLHGRDLAGRAKEGDSTALKIYSNSAQITATTVRGLSEAMGLSLQDGKTAVVFHGGVFKYEDYGKRVVDILGRDGSNAPIIFTKDMETEPGGFEINACLDGAALAALVADNKSEIEPQAA